MDITQNELKALVPYDKDTGAFTRIAALSKRSARHVGSICGSRNKVTGYVEMNVGGRKQYAHRLAWIYVYGYVPDGMRVDHVNRERSDNRISNLRLASHADNLRNCKVRIDNTSGVKGVSFDAARGKWAASVGKKKIV